MTILSIVTDVKKLSVRCNPAGTVTSKHVERIIKDLLDTARAHPTCVGLAANQIGYNARIFVMLYRNGWIIIVDPKLIRSPGGVDYIIEGCLSVPGVRKRVMRYTKIRVEYFDDEGELVARNFNNFHARIFQHELDHLNGKLI